ncbi:MAG: DsbA family protein [Steroidobacteraceae bacterium]
MQASASLTGAVKRAWWLAPALILLWSPRAGAGGAADLDALRADVEALKAGQASIQRDLQEIRSQLRAKASPSPAAAEDRTIAVAGAMSMGERTAPLTLVEFTDFQCPFCVRHARDTLPQIERDYVRTGKLRYVVRDFPIGSLHPDARRAHEAVRCAGDQNRYWEMRARVFASPKDVAVRTLTTHARELGLDVAAFQGCLDSGRHATQVQADVAAGVSAGVTGTPTFFLARTAPGDADVRVARSIVGAQPYENFRQAIDALLSGAADPKP